MTVDRNEAQEAYMLEDGCPAIQPGKPGAWKKQ